MADLAEFLRARLDEDEQAARTVFAGSWVAESNSVWDGEGDQVCRTTTDEDAVHIARWDSARVLAEVQAKRAILDLADEASGDHWLVHGDRCVGKCECAEDDPGNGILKHLAAVYADFPGYRQDWRP